RREQNSHPGGTHRGGDRSQVEVAIGGRSCAGQHFGFTVASIPMLFPPSGAAAAWKVARWWPRGNPLMRGRRHGDIRCWSVLFLTKAEQAGPTRLIGSCRINLTI
ncbi:Os09g0532900, partial [Oryza sativa Japonica Group]